MARMSDTMIQRLIDALDKNTSANTDVAKATGTAAASGRAAMSSAAAQGQAQASGTSARGAGDSMGLSGLRQGLNAGGMNTAASLVGGFSSGGLPGLGVAAGVAAIGAGSEFFQDAQNIHARGREAAMRVSPYAHPAFREAARSIGEGQESINRQEKYSPDAFNEALQDTNYGQNGGILWKYLEKKVSGTNAEKGYDAARVSLNAESDKQNSISDDITSRLDRFFAPFAQVGARTSAAQREEVGKLFKLQAEASYANHADNVAMATKLVATGTGTQGYLNHR